MQPDGVMSGSSDEIQAGGGAPAPSEVLAQWMGFADVFCASAAEIAEQLDRSADIAERQASESFDHLEAVTTIAGMAHLFAGAAPRDDREALVEQHLQAMMAGFVRADYLRQALQAMAGILRGFAEEANERAAATIGADPSLRSSAVDVAERMREVHERVGLTALRTRMLGRLGALGADSEG